MNRRNFLATFYALGAIYRPAFCNEPSLKINSFFFTCDTDGSILLLYENGDNFFYSTILPLDFCVFHENTAERYTHSNQNAIYFHSNFIKCQKPTAMIIENKNEEYQISILEFDDLKPKLVYVFKIPDDMIFISTFQNIFADDKYNFIFRNKESYHAISVKENFEIVPFKNSDHENILSYFKPNITWISSNLSRTEKNYFLAETDDTALQFFTLDENGLNIVATLEQNCILHSNWSLNFNTQKINYISKKDIFFGTLHCGAFNQTAFHELFVFFVQTKYLSFLYVDSNQQLQVLDFISLDDFCPKLFLQPNLKSNTEYSDLLLCFQKNQFQVFYVKDGKIKSQKFTVNDTEIDWDNNCEFLTLPHYHNKTSQNYDFAIYGFQIFSNGDLFQCLVRLDSQEKLEFRWINVSKKFASNKNLNSKSNHFNLNSNTTLTTQTSLPYKHILDSSLSFSMGNQSLMNSAMKSNFLYFPKETFSDEFSVKNNSVSRNLNLSANPNPGSDWVEVVRGNLGNIGFSDWDGWARKILSTVTTTAEQASLATKLALERSNERFQSVVNPPPPEQKPEPPKPLPIPVNKNSKIRKLVIQKIVECAQKETFMARIKSEASQNMKLEYLSEEISQQYKPTEGRKIIILDVSNVSVKPYSSKKKDPAVSGGYKFEYGKDYEAHFHFIIEVRDEDFLKGNIEGKIQQVICLNSPSPFLSAEETERLGIKPLNLLFNPSQLYDSDDDDDFFRQK